MEEPAPRDLTRRQILIGVSSSLVASLLFLIFIQPLLGLRWRIVLSNISISNDGASQQASLGETDRYGFLFWAFLLSLLLTSHDSKLLQNSRPYPSKDWRAPSAQARVGWMNMKSR